MSQRQDDLTKIQDILMAMYDYIDGGIPCPYPSPEEWRRELRHSAFEALALVRKQMALEARARRTGETDQVQAVSVSPAPQPVIQESRGEVSADDTEAEAQEAEEASSSGGLTNNERAEIAERKKQEQEDKRQALRATLMRLKKKQSTDT